MQNSNLEHTIQMPIFDRNYYVIDRGNDRDKAIILAKITDLEESRIDEGKTIVITIEGRDYEIEPKQLICYGDVNLNTGSEDYNTVDKFDVIDEPIEMPVNYDFTTHTCKSNVKRYKTAETTSAAKVIQYAYGCLGKPKKIVIFKEGHVY